MTNTITKERRDAIRAAAEKATPGDWFVSGVRSRIANVGTFHQVNRYDEDKKKDENIAAVGYDEKTGVGFADAHHIANCDPQTVLALIDALDAAEARAAQADHAASCLADMVKDLQDAAEAKTGEPVAWMWRDNGHYWFTEDAGMADRKAKTGFLRIPLYAAPPAAEPVIPEGWVLVPVELHPYDAGLLSDWGGGNVEWWQDYLRHELNRAHEFYNSQLAAAPALVSEKEAE